MARLKGWRRAWRPGLPDEAPCCRSNWPAAPWTWPWITCTSTSPTCCTSQSARCASRSSGARGKPAWPGQARVPSAAVSILPRAGRGSPLEIVLGSAKVRRQVQLQVPHYVTIPVIVASTELLGTVPALGPGVRTPGFEVAELPAEMPAIQISLIWHRQQQHAPALRWLREQIAQVFQHLGHP